MDKNLLLVPASLSKYDLLEKQQQNSKFSKSAVAKNSEVLFINTESSRVMSHAFQVPNSINLR